MPIVKLTDRFVAAVKADYGARKSDYFDEITTGLCLRVTGGGVKTWFLVYSKPSRERVWLKIGIFSTTGLAQARRRAKEARGEVEQGLDPQAEKRALAASQTVRDLVENYLTRAVADNRTQQAIARRLRKNVADVIGDVKLSAMHRRDLTRCLDLVKDRGADTEANRVFEDMRAMIRWAKGRGDLDENLMEGMRRPSEPKVRERVLSAEEIATVWAKLAETDMSESTRRILRLCLILGARVGEVCGMARDELDFEHGVWILPAVRVKNATEHKLPLPDMAVGIIREQIAATDALARRKRRDPSTYVFPGPGDRAPITGHSIAKAVKRNQGVFGVAAWTPHDLRRSAATHMEGIGISPFVIGHVLNHLSVTSATVTSRVYARHDYQREMRDALELWTDRLAGIVAGGAAVIPMRVRHA